MKMPSPTKYIKQNFIECKGVYLLSLLLIKTNRIFPHFFINDKRPVFDGDFDFLDSEQKILKTFRCQIKTTKSNQNYFNIEYKYLKAVEHNITLDPFFFFIVFLKEDENGCYSKSAYYYIDLNNIEKSKLDECLKTNKSLKLKKDDLIKIDNLPTFVQTLNNYKDVLSMKDLTKNETITIYKGITYLSDALNDMKSIKTLLFPNFSYFSIDYIKETTENIKTGLFSKKHDVLAVYVIKKTENINTIGRFNKNKNYFAISRTFGKHEIEMKTFYSIMEWIINSAFKKDEFILDIINDKSFLILASEIIFALIYYEYYELKNIKIEEMIKLEEINIGNIKLEDYNNKNPYKKYITKIVKRSKENNIFKYKKLWNHFIKYTSNHISYTYDIKEMSKSSKIYFENICVLVNECLINIFSNENFWYFKTLNYLYDPINKYDKIHLSVTSSFIETFKLDNINTYDFENFENLLSFSPLYLSLINYVKKYICLKYKCRYETVLIDGIKPLIK